jgi:hypothetical protein
MIDKIFSLLPTDMSEDTMRSLTLLTLVLDVPELLLYEAENPLELPLSCFVLVQLARHLYYIKSLT